jgi:fido (protein-threonine AMPylation protein)
LFIFFKNFLARPVLDTSEIRPVCIHPQLLGNTAYQLDHNTFPIDECLIRFHHRLVSTIHPFNNGNGRHAGMMTDVLAAKRGRPVFTWGAGTNLATENVGRATYLAALRALDDNENNVKPLIGFARS